MPRQTTFMKATEVRRAWHHVDAEGKILGRIAASIAPILMGKHHPAYTPHVDTGDFVVVTNASKVVLTGRKGEQRMHMTYSGYPGGLKSRSINHMLEKHPERVLEQAVRRMLPKTRLGRAMFKKLKVYAGPDHDLGVQGMQSLTI
jgi:large subunit ribosomal protein L13